MMSFTNCTTRRGQSFDAEYLELVPNEQIRHTDTFDDPDLPGVMVTTVTPKSVSAGTELSIVPEGTPDPTIRRGVLRRMAGVGGAPLATLVEAEIPDRPHTGARPSGRGDLPSSTHLVGVRRGRRRRAPQQVSGATLVPDSTLHGAGCGGYLVGKASASLAPPLRVLVAEQRGVMGRRKASGVSLEDPGVLRRFVTNLGEGIYITNREGVILDANPAFLSMLGIASLKELRGRSAADLIVDPTARERELELLATHGAVRDFEIQIRRPDGGIRWVVDTAYQVIEEDSGRVFYHGILVDITARKELERRLHEAVIRDALTGSFNRRYLAELSARLEETGGVWGVVVCDLDHFKEVNDRLGHTAGDDLLVRFTRFLMRHSRATDSVVRLGGDEFLMLLLGANEDVTGAVAGRLREAASQVSPVEFSLGWACRESTEKVERTIARADERLIIIRQRERGYAVPRSG